MSNYRSAAPPCPGCRGALEPRALGDVEIDVCADCLGVWFDWFDGELISLARRTIGEGPGTAAGHGDPAREHPCPRCQDELGADVAHGVELLRCSSCAGVFVARGVLHELARVELRDDELPPPDAFARVLAWLKQVVVGTPA